MIKLFQKAFYIFKNNMVFSYPFLLYLLFILLAMPYLLSNSIMLHPKILLSLSLILLTVCHTAGWFHINKAGVNDYNENDDMEEIASKAIKNIKSYFSGIGEHFLKTLIGYIVLFLFYTIIVFIITNLCLHYFGEPVIATKYSEIKGLKTVEEFSKYFSAFSMHDIAIFKIWFFIILITILTLNFLCILYFSILFTEKFNTLKTLAKTITVFIKNIFSCIIIIAFMFVIYIAFNTLSLIFGNNTIGITIMIILSVLYLNYYIILVLCFYDEKTKDNSNNRTELIGEDESRNKIS